MLNEPKAEDIPGQATDGQEEASAYATGWLGKIEEKYRRAKEHAETYPYVWGSYILVYGTLGFWLTYRWRKLRQTEDRVRILAKKLREQYEAEDLANSKAVKDQLENSASLAKKPPPSADKAAK